jgi:hypothetical protein
MIENPLSMRLLLPSVSVCPSMSLSAHRVHYSLGAPV